METVTKKSLLGQMLDHLDLRVGDKVRITRPPLENGEFGSEIVWSTGQLDYFAEAVRAGTVYIICRISDARSQEGHVELRREHHEDWSGFGYIVPCSVLEIVKRAPRREQFKLKSLGGHAISVSDAGFQVGCTLVPFEIAVEFGKYAERELSMTQ